MLSLYLFLYLGTCSLSVFSKSFLLSTMSPNNVKTVKDRRQLPTSSGLGTHFSSPLKARDKRKTATFVRIPGHAKKRQRLLEKMASLLRGDTDPAPEATIPDHVPIPDIGVEDDWVDDGPVKVDEPEIEPVKMKNRILPDDAAIRLYTSWKSLIPTLITPLLQYINVSIGQPIQFAFQVTSGCVRDCHVKETPILCLYFDRKSLFNI
jgi:hypothetical protein